MPDEPMTVDEETELFGGDEPPVQDSKQPAATSSSDGENPPEAVGEPPDRDAIGLKILGDDNLPPEDYERAISDPEFLSQLVDAYIQEEEEEKSKAQTSGQPPEGKPLGEEKRKPKRGYKRTIERLNERTLELEAQLEQERRKRMELEARSGQAARPEQRTDTSPKAATQTRPKPKQDEFESYESFLEALADWAEQRADEKIRAALDAERRRSESERRASLTQEHQRRVAQALQEQEEAARKAHEDYDEVFAELDTVRFSSPVVVEAMLRTGKYGEMAYFLGTHLEDAERLAKLEDPGEIYLAVGEINSKITATPKPNGANAPTRIPSSKAPHPPRHVAGGAAKTVKDSEYWANQADPMEFMEAFNKNKLSW